MKTALAALIALILFGCSSMPKKDLTMDSPSLALFKIDASGKYFMGVSLTMFGSSPLTLYMQNDETGKVYEGKTIGSSFCAVANIPQGKYTIIKADSPLKQPLIGTPVMVNFGDNPIHVTITKSDVNYFGFYEIETKQEGTSLAIEKLKHTEPTQEEFEEIEKLINQKHQEAGWRFNRPEE